MIEDKKTKAEPEGIVGWIIGVGIVTVLILVIAVADRNQNIVPQGKNPMLVGFDPPLFEFGTIRQANLIEHKFRLVNRTTNDASISLIKVSCDCTVVATNFVGQVLRSGEELVVPVIYQSGTREGYAESTVLFVLDSPDGRFKTEAKLRGRIEAEFFVERSALDFGVLSPGQSATQTTLLQPGKLSGPPLATTQMNVGPFHVLVSHQVNVKQTSTNAAVTVTFFAPRLTQRQQFSRSLKLETLSERVPDVEFALKALVIPDVEITPELLVLPPGDSLGESRFTVRTSLPSRIIRALSRSAEQTGVIGAARSGDEDSEWEVVHHFLVANSALADATQLDVELEIRRNAGGIEARFASAQIKSLAK
jgi:hypothetical protein